MNAESLVIVVVDRSGRHEHRITGVVDLGREGADLLVSDPAVSRRHVRLDASGAAMVATDLGSSNGTFLDGVRITGPTAVSPGQVLTVGDSTIQVIAAAPPATAAPAAAAPAAPQPPPPPVGPASVTTPRIEPAPPPTPSTSTVGPALLRAPEQVLRNEAVEVRYVPGTHGEAVAASLQATATRARRDLAGLGSEPDGSIPVLHLTDPFNDGTEVVTNGAVVDDASGEVWIVATPEAPPEAPHRVLALVFGRALPARADIGYLLEGYGLLRAGTAAPDEALAGLALPSLHEAESELRDAMAASFVRFLLRREDDATFHRLLAGPAGRLDDTARELYGRGLAQLEQQWRRKVATGAPDVKTGEFLRLSLRYLRPYKLRQAEIFVYMLLSLAFTASFPFVTRRLFDTALPSGEFDQVLNLLLILGAAFVVSLVAGVRQAYQTAWVSGAVTRDIREAIFARTQELPASWYADHPQGDVLSRLFSDVGAVQNGLSQAIGQGIFQMISLLVSGVIMMTIDWRLGLIVLISAPLVGFVYRRMADGALQRSLDAQEQSSALLSIAAESYRANPVVKMFGLAGYEKRRFGQQGDRVFRSVRRVNLWGGLFGLSVNLIVTVVRLVVLGLGGWLILEGHFTTGGLVAFLSIMGEVLAPVTVLVTLSQDIQSSMGSLTRINEVIDAEPEPAGSHLPALPPVSREIRFSGVSLSYTPERRALDSLDVVIPAGTRVAFVGPSGSGKSTVLRLLMRMHEPDEGAILVDGVDLRQATLSSWRDQLGVVFQDSFLFDTTLRENVALGREGATNDDVVAAGAGAEIDAFVDSLPRRWDSLVGEGGANLSGGQRQRVAIARALIRHPRVLVLDEATSALDPATERQINDTLDGLAAGRTIVSVTHRLASISGYDRIFVIVDGRLAEEGTHDELLTRRGAYARLWAEQTGAPLPEPPAYDARAALERVPFLHDLDPAILTELESELVTLVLDSGRSMDDGGGLVFVSSGRGEVLAPGPGEPTAIAELRAGDVFGLTSVLGGPATSSLRAIDSMELRLLSWASIDEAAYRHPALRAARFPAPTIGAPSGVRIRRVSPGHATMASPVPGSTGSVVAPTLVSSTRATGSFPRMG